MPIDDEASARASAHDHDARSPGATRRGRAPCDIVLPPSIRSYEATDAGSLRSLLNDARVAQPLFGAVLGPDRLDACMRVDWGEAAPRDGLRLVACMHEGGSLLGAARIDDGELSYFVAPVHWRRGVGTSLARAACALAPAGRSLTAIVARDNPGSATLLEKLGFRFAGIAHARGGTYAERAGLRFVLRR